MYILIHLTAVLAVPDTLLIADDLRHLIPSKSWLEDASKLIGSILDFCICTSLIVVFWRIDINSLIVECGMSPYPDWSASNEYHPTLIVYGFLSMHSWIVLNCCFGLRPSRASADSGTNILSLRSYSLGESTFGWFLGGLVIVSVQFFLSEIRFAGVEEDMKWGFSQLMQVIQLSTLIVQLQNYLSEAIQINDDTSLPRYRRWLDLAKEYRMADFTKHFLGFAKVFWIIASFMIILLVIRIPIGLVLSPVNICVMLVNAAKKGWKLCKSLSKKAWKLFLSLFRRQQPASPAEDIELAERERVDRIERQSGEEISGNGVNEMDITDL